MRNEHSLTVLNVRDKGQYLTSRDDLESMTAFIYQSDIVQGRSIVFSIYGCDGRFRISKLHLDFAMIGSAPDNSVKKLSLPTYKETPAGWECLGNARPSCHCLPVSYPKKPVDCLRPQSKKIRTSLRSSRPRKGNYQPRLRTKQNRRKYANAQTPWQTQL
jgi:hypothetical protein